MWEKPSVTTFKTFFARDFNFAPVGDPDNLDYITDTDINRAISEAEINFNPGLYAKLEYATNVFMYLAAFFLVFNIQNSSKGINSQCKFPISSTSAGGVSVSYQIPARYAEKPLYAMYTHNGYGMKYLSLTLPLLIGNVTLVEGDTT